MSIGLQRGMGFLRLVLAVLLFSSNATVARAASITIDFSGQMFFWDLGNGTPGQAALEDAFATVGVYSVGRDHNGVVRSMGSPVSLSMTYEQTTAPDAFGSYAGTLLGGTIVIGSLEYQIGPAPTQNLRFLAPVSGPPVTLPAFDQIWYPNFVNLKDYGYWNPLTSATFDPTQTVAQMVMSYGLLGSNNFSPTLGADLHVTRVSVPEARACWLVAVGLALGFALLRSKRVTH